MPDSFTLKNGLKTTLPAGFLIGHAQDEEAATGCSVILCEEAALAAVSVRGAAPATRETDLLDPRNTVERINAVVLSGGSAFGLDAAGGVMRWLSERNRGFRFAGSCVPIVCGASIFDLGVGSPSVFPNNDMGYAACVAASSTVKTGNVGAGIGASVGKILGTDYSMKSGIGCASIEFGEIIVAALVCVNAAGNIFDRSTSKLIAGVRNPFDNGSLLDAYQAFSLMLQSAEKPPSQPTNTTISCVITNGVLTKAQASHVADMAHDGYARAIEPVHTGFDGDTVFILSSTTQPCSSDMIGILAARVMESAIHNALHSAQSAYGLPAASDFADTVSLSIPW